MVTNESKRNYIYYVSELEQTPSNGHFRKMDAGSEIVRQVNDVVKNLQINKFSSYDGEVIDADSVGIVFPAHMWGISYAVQSFLNRLRIKTGTYLYIVIAGSRFNLKANEQMGNKILVDQIKKALHKVGTAFKVFVRCIDGIRTSRTDSEYRSIKDIREKINVVLEKVLYYEEGRVKDIVRLAETDRKSSQKTDDKGKRISLYGKNIDVDYSDIKLSNIFLDDTIFEGVRLCQAV